MFYYRLNENNEIMDFSDWKYAEECIETEREIKTIDGIAHFTDEDDYKSLVEKSEKRILSTEQIASLKEELAKAKEDVEQVELFGMERTDYETKKARCVEIIQQLRILEKEV